MNILYLIFLFLFFECLGALLAPGLRIRKDGHLVRIGLGLITASYMALFLGNYGWLNRDLVFALMAIVILIRIRELSRLLILTVKKAAVFVNNLSVYEKILFIILVMQISINFFLALTPPAEWDGLAYHLTIPKLILQEDRMIRYSDYGGANYPLFVEMIFTLGMLINGPELVKLICWSISVLTIMAIYGLAVGIRLKPALGLIGSLVFYTTQVVSMWAGKSYIDIAFAFFVTLSAIALIEFFQKKEISLILIWLFLSVLPGIKHSGIFLSFIMGLYLISHILVQKKALKPVVKATALGLLIISSLNSPWYFMPKDRPVSSDDSILYLSVLARFSPVRNYLNRWLFTLKGLTLSCDRDGRIGPLFLSFLPLLILVRPLKEIRLLLIISISYLAILLFFCYPLPRYILPVMPLLGIAVAWAFAKLGEGDKVLNYFLRGCLIFSFIFNLGLTFYNHRLELEYLSGKLSRDKFLNAKVTSFSAINYINKNIHDGRVLLIGEARAYYLKRPFFLGGALSGWPERKLKELYEFLKQKNITSVMVNERIVYDRVKNNIELQKVLKYLDKYLELLYHQGHFKIYKLTFIGES